MTAPTDTFGVTAAFDKPGYKAGDVMTLTISGGDVRATTDTSTVTATLSLTAADGSTGSVTAQVPVSKTVSTPESVVITSVTDTSGRTWAVAAGGLTATATA